MIRSLKGDACILYASLASPRELTAYIDQIYVLTFQNYLRTTALLIRVHCCVRVTCERAREIYCVTARYRPVVYAVYVFVCAWMCTCLWRMWKGGPCTPCMEIQQQELIFQRADARPVNVNLERILRVRKPLLDSSAPGVWLRMCGGELGQQMAGHSPVFARIPLAWRAVVSARGRWQLYHSNADVCIIFVAARCRTRGIKYRYFSWRVLS